MTTSNMSLNEPTVGTTAGPTWATETNSNWTSIDAHDHTSGKGVQLTPSSLNINGDLEFNQNSASELKNVIFDSSVSAASTNYSVYQASGNLYWRNNSGTAVQITDGSAVKTTGGSISGMSSTAVVLFSSNSYAFKFDVSASAGMNYDGIAKMSFSDIDLYKYDAAGSLAKVTLKFLGSGTSAALTVPDESGTLLSTATSFAGAINIDATGGSGSITLDAATDINLDSDTGLFYFKDGGTAIGKISNSSSDLVIENEVDAKDIIFKQFDGSEVVRMADDRRLYFYDKGGEYIVGDGTDLTLTSGGDIDLTATSDVNIPAQVGLTFGADTEKIEADASNNVTLSASGDIILDADGADVTLKDGGTAFGTLKQASGHLVIQPESSKEIILNDQAGTAALTVDTSDQNVSINNGSIVISTAGQGITFGGDPDSRVNSPTPGDRTLYDYEEGTWSAELRGQTGRADTPVIVTDAQYIKIGKLVYIVCGFPSKDTTGASGQMEIRGLPFTTASGNNPVAEIGYMTGLPYTQYKMPIFTAAASSTILSGYEIKYDGTKSDWNITAADPVTIRVSLTYITS